MCRTYGAGLVRALGTRRCRTGLTCDAPPALELAWDVEVT